MMRDDPGLPAGAGRLGRLLRRATPGASRGAPPAKLHRAFAAALAKGKAGAARERSAWRAHASWWCAAAGVTVVAAAVAVSIALPARPLTFQLDGLTSAAGGSSALEAQVTGGAMHFSDGSVLTVERGARTRVLGIDARGARLAVERGNVRFAIRHRRETSWSVTAGPFEILVTGTAFDVRWTDQGQLRVRLHEGAVVVRGSLVGAGMVVKAGQTLLARLDTGEVRLGTDESPQLGASAVRAVDTPSANPSAPTLPPALDPPASSSSTPASPAPPARRSTSHRAKPVATLARPAPPAPRGPDDAEECVARCDDAGLDALARVARRRGELDVARRALLALRERHADSPLSHDAAFVLGRLDEDQGRAADALRFYDAYLDERDEATGGHYRSFALGRKMALVERLSGAAAARPLAELYLRLYPNGAHGAYARHLLSTP